jgi:hypothetical protein
MPTITGFWFVGGSRNSNGNREWKVRYRVKGDNPTSSPIGDGPANIMQTPGLPQPYSQWLIQGDVDIWAWCKWDSDVKPVLADETNLLWNVDLVFTTDPDSQKNRCRQSQVEDPLLEPIKLSGSTIKYTEEVRSDIYGNPIAASSKELLRGPQVEFDRSRSRVHIEMNVPNLLYDFVMGYMDNVNISTLWGMPPRCVKLSDFNWERKYQGSCEIYYTWIFDFDIRVPDPVTGAPGFDRVDYDESNKCLAPFTWNSSKQFVLNIIPGTNMLPDPNNPSHFDRYQDPKGNVTKAILNGCGVPNTGSPVVTPASSQAVMGYLAIPRDAQISVFWGNIIPLPDTYNLYWGFGTPTTIPYVTGLPVNQVTNSYQAGSPFSPGGSLVNNVPYYFQVAGVYGGKVGPKSAAFTATPVPLSSTEPLVLASTGDPGAVFVQYYPAAELTDLGIPTVLDYSGNFLPPVT